MNIGWIVCMSLWAVFMGAWVYFGPIKKSWRVAIYLALIGLFCALFSLVFPVIEVSS